MTKPLTIKQHAILNAAIEKWGSEAQIEMIIEECIELALALQKLKRKRGDFNEKLFNVCDEIADVKIMLNQAEGIFDQKIINERVDYKINRLKERIDNNLS